MRLPPVLLAALPASLLAALISACAQPAAPPTAQTLAAALTTLIGDAACTTDAQCRTVGVGARSCGGPAGYRAWSTAVTDAAQLAELSQRLAAAQRQAGDADGMRSACSLVPDPGARCLAGHCQLATANAPTAPAR